jgi:hypothetical protein
VPQPAAMTAKKMQRRRLLRTDVLSGPVRYAHFFVS